ncbi:hypothetical protein HD554DRAFT_2098757 [Boletus coccyginus]|nr:hypothetical protein HD554DRAFT_2098757 [Boletus coccyginus]
MFVPSVLDVRSSLQVGPQACKPFSLHSDVCVGDLVVIVVCSIAGIGWVLWGMHAIRKMRQPSPFDEEDKEEPDEELARLDPFYIPNQPGWTPGPAERVRIRLALGEPDEAFCRPTAPISPTAYDAQDAMTMPRTPPRAAGQSQRASSHRSSRHTSPIRGGTYGEGYEYGVNDGYIRNVSPSRARGPAPHRPQSGHRSHQPMRRMNEDAVMYGYAY